MTAAPTILGPTITSYLDRFERRRRRQRIVRAVGTAVMLTLLWASLWCVADRLAGLPRMVRLAALLVNGAGVFAVVTPSVLALARPADVRGAAAEIERRRRRFGERLMTITSRALGEESIRGSSDMLRAIGEEVRAEAAGHDPADLLPWRPVLGPWVATGLVAVTLLAVSTWTWLDLPSLARRYVAPWSYAARVTTTRLTVTPGDVEIGEGDALAVRVRAVRIGELPPVLNVRAAGQPWHEMPMTPVARVRPDTGGSPTGGRVPGGFDFEARVPDVDCDLEYFVAGGDAESAAFRVTMLRKPAISAFRIRYAYPPYTRLPAREVENAGGEIEAPVGTEVTVAVESTEPLKLAVMTIGGGAVRMTATPDPRVHEARFTVRDDRRYTIRMASTRDVSGSVDSTATVTSVPTGASISPPAFSTSRAGSRVYGG